MQISIAVCHFQHEGWQKQFFPDDLPEDWRFDYYANEFDSVFFSRADQESSGGALIRQALMQADAGFLVVIEGADDKNMLTDNCSPAKCSVVYVKFLPATSMRPILAVPGVYIEQADIVSQQNLSATACVLRVNSVSVIQNQDVKQLLMYFQTNYAEFDRVYVFLGQHLQNVETINTVGIINDLL